MRARSSLAASSRSAPTRRCLRKTRHIERLEARLLMTAAPQDASADDFSLLAQPCDCPVCRGLLPAQGDSPTAVVSSSGGPEAAPLTSLPLLSSNSTATAKLFLDFNGHFESSWSFRTNVTTPAFDQDGNVNDFSASELAAIQEIWARVAEDYAPFNIDVTTIDPGHQSNGVVAVVAIGGSYSDWYAAPAAGVAFVGGFANFSPNVGYVFANNLGGNARMVAEAASHEAGHLFGLSHQSRWVGTSMTEPYHSGDANWAPIMGSSYYSTRSTWHYGNTNSYLAFQDDLAVISGASNGFGYKTDDFGSTTGTASSLAVSGTNVNFAGLIGRTDDQDVWSFTTTGGALSFQLTGATYGSNLDAVLELVNSSGTIITTSAPTGSLGASISQTVGAGTYYLIARGAGDYGNMGQYTITGTLPSASSAPTASVSVSGTSLTSGGTLAFGTTTAGTPVTRTITVTNAGNAVLTLSSLNPSSMPAGFTLVQNLQATSLNPGASTTFIVRLDATATGSFSGQVSFSTNDASANPFTIQVTGAVTAPSAGLSVSGTALNDGGTLAFGSTMAGTSVTRTITVTNGGSAVLTLTSLNPSSMPAGYTLVQNLQSTSLNPGASTTFIVRLDGTVAGSYSGQISLTTNDPNHNPFTFQVTGTVTAPSVGLSVSGTTLNHGGTLSFGTTTAGTAVTRTITVTNSGNAVLTLSSLNPSAMPAGFTLVQNLQSTSLNPGASTTFIVRLDGTTAGSYSGQISLTTNDPNRNPFTFQISGSVTAAPVLVPEISLNVGGTSLTSGGTVSFGSTTTGTAVTRTITVTNQGSATLTLTSLSGVTLPTGFTLAQNFVSTSLAPGASTTFVLRLSAVAAGSFNGQISVLSNDSNSSPFTFSVTGSVANPQTFIPAISLSVDGVALAPGGMLNFGTCDTGTTITKTVTITNTGNGTLTLSSLSGVTLPAGFTLLQDIQSTSLAPGASTTFVIRLNTSAACTANGQLTLTSNDPANGSLTFTIGGTVRAPAYQVTADDGNPGNRLAGSWKPTSGKGYANDLRTANKGNGSIFSTWNFTNLPNGQYQVWGTWTAGAKNATNAPYTISSGGTLLKTVRVSQRVTPAGFAADGVSWKFLGAVTISKGNLLVKLTNNANGLVIADAIRIQQVLPSSAELLTTEYAGVGGQQNDTHSPFTSRSETHLDALPLPGTTASASHAENESFSSLLDLLSRPSQPHSAPPAIDQVFSGLPTWHPLESLLA
jgi:hypothetical protein